MFIAIKFKNILKFILILSVLIVSIFSTIYFIFPFKYIDLIKENSEKYNVKPDLILSIINTESRFNKDAISHAGASGLMQIMEPTAIWIADKLKEEDFTYENIFDPKINISFGSWYINYLLDYFGNDLKLALCGYNAGIGNVNKWLSNKKYSSDGKTLDVIPFKETKKYVERVLFFKKSYEKLIPFVPNLK